MTGAGKVSDAASSAKASSAAGHCFVAGTLVSCESGFVPIEDIKAGDLVYAYNEVTEKTELQKVAQTFVHDENQLLVISLHDSEIITTKKHPFWTEEKGWVLVGEIEVGDTLRTRNGKNISVESIEIKVLKQPVLVYNIEVENAHTYFVGDDEILVHNKAAKNHYRPKIRGANAKDRKMIESVAKKHGVDRRGFGDYIEQIKYDNYMGPSETFDWKQLEEYAKEFKEYGDISK